MNGEGIGTVPRQHHHHVSWSIQRVKWVHGCYTYGIYSADAWTVVESMANILLGHMATCGMWEVYASAVYSLGDDQ